MNSVRKFLNAQENVKAYKTELKQQISYAVVARERKWQADLIDMQKFANQNDGVTFLLTIIDIFTKYAFVIPLANKSSMTVSKAFFDLFSNMEEARYSLPLFLQTDNGPEFISKPLKKICHWFNVNQLFSFPYHPLGYIERFNRTLKQKIYNWMISNQRFYGHYISYLPQLVNNYNHSIHSTIKNMPYIAHFCSLNQLRCRKLQQSIYDNMKAKKKKTPSIPNPFKIGDLVHVLSYFNPYIPNKEQYHIKINFNKVKTPKWTTDVFKIIKVTNDDLNPRVIRYTLKDKFGFIFDRKFYHHELQPI